MTPEPMKKEESEEVKKIVRGQYPDLFDIAESGQSVWLEKPYMESLLSLFERILSLQRQKDMERLKGLIPEEKPQLDKNDPDNYGACYAIGGFNDCRAKILSALDREFPV